MSLQRKKPLRSRSPIKQGGTPIKKVNRKRRASAFERAYGSAQRVAFVNSLGCSAPLRYGLGRHDGPVQNAHIIGGGAGRKADADKIIPLCQRHHATLHSVGVETFEQAYGLNLAARAAEIHAAWLSHHGADQ